MASHDSDGHGGLDRLIATINSHYDPDTQSKILDQLVPPTRSALRHRVWQQVLAQALIMRLALVAQEKELGKVKKAQVQKRIKVLHRALVDLSESIEKLDQDQESLNYLAYSGGVFERGNMASDNKTISKSHIRLVRRQFRKSLLDLKSASFATAETTTLAIARFEGQSNDVLEKIGGFVVKMHPQVPMTWTPIRKAVFGLSLIWEECRGKAPTTKSVVVGAGFKTANVDKTEFDAFLKLLMRPLVPSFKKKTSGGETRLSSFLADIRAVQRFQKQSKIRPSE